MVVINKATEEYIHKEEKEFLGVEIVNRFPAFSQSICGYESASVELLQATNYKEWIDAAFYNCFATWDMYPITPVTKLMETLSPEEKEKRVIAMLKQRPISAALESAMFTFKISGVPRTFLAQITRHRQMSFGVQSLRVSSCYANLVRAPQVLIEEESPVLGKYIDTVNRCREVYREMIEDGVPMEQARSIMPMGTTTTMSANMRLRDVIAYCRARTSGITQDEHSYVVALLVRCLKKDAPEFYENFIKSDHLERLMKKYMEE